MNKELIRPRIGTVRNDLQFRLRTMLENGVTIAFGSDWPVTSQIPLRALGVPVNRLAPGVKDADGWNIAEAITLEESLTFYTKNAAYQLFRENDRGQLEVGMKADFLALNRNPLTIDPSEVSKISIKAVYQNGLQIR